jgi:hypothetical protein
MDNVQVSEALQVIQICAWSMRTVNFTVGVENSV